ncbi:MAG: replication-associated recombination protein A [Candidatus Brocadia sp. AMX2]|uniref:Replication-associated recombination protein A n=1 Tax=Candidatus Brocadia sinica JPN1 TaxID=1197129 RepID=A0ABQ0JTB2_9BACT|nr:MULTISPECIES: replication-associated recombination protein A [Brocadia]KXK30607.1 MAG: ATPase [Candidatus Brocadia sinica]MBC6931889.1 replication-associated recombination protein A [Candidatus Brocadia sp.]MBL1168346.1 replication-associated recombination protein A [Candidatus Brocadia sp. AMX1]KAA0243399.1 MAG: replication-associated recombination protein A [Candidatus Brocadia sp. AMX2]MCE7866107.1 replication-associated recombination protein A [Candidatus Brocadia sp. AMX2]
MAIKKPERDLFSTKASITKKPPLADRMRPRKLEEFVGQEHLVGPDKILRRLVDNKELISLIFWGPPGVGKTTLASIVAQATDAHFVAFSAVLSGVKDIREVIEDAGNQLKYSGKKTILFVDEIHRFNKAQQDAFLHHVEDGTITLIGATTENPSFEVNAPLLSRCKVLVLEQLTEDHISAIMTNAVRDKERGLGYMNAEIHNDAFAFIANLSQGDARVALNTLEASVMLAKPSQDGKRMITLEIAQEAMQRKALLYDKGGEEHYNVISAFIKSLRGSDPDAALYWLARMLDAGEDPLFIARRMIIFASEDIGNADPVALQLAVATKDAFHFVGLPEGWIPLAQCVTYLACAPKSNASYMAYFEAMKDVKEKGALSVPFHIRNAPTKLMKDLGYGMGYKYPHSFGGYVEQVYLPDELQGREYYKPTDNGFDKVIKERLEFYKKMRNPLE